MLSNMSNLQTNYCLNEYRIAHMQVVNPRHKHHMDRQ